MPEKTQLAARAAQLSDALYARMQRPGFEDALKQAFTASPTEIGRAAVEAARNHK